MKKGKPNRENAGIEFWQSSTDLLLALLLILLLVISLLMLYLMQLPETEFFELWGTQQTQVGASEREYNGTSWEQFTGSGSGDGDGSQGRYLTDEFHYEFPIPSAGDGDGEEESRAAVLANVVDGETNRVIRKAGVTFELYQVYNRRTGRPEIIDETNLHGTIRFLNTYYPEKIEYRNYETTANGLYFLPEKVELGGYYFKQVSDLEGYDPADQVYYEIDDTYDWNQPFVVSIPVYPCKNVVRIRLVDSETGEYVQDGSFQAVAAENITTADGTVRFLTNAVADNFSVDNSVGYAESSELYLGKYYVTQSTPARYYTTMNESLDVELLKRDGSEQEIHEFTVERTAFTVRLTDDLFASQAIAGARFSLSAENHPTQYGETDELGMVTFNMLEKETLYTLTQVSSVGGYQVDRSAHTFYVDPTGHIQGEAKAKLELTNFIPRTTIGLRDVLTHGSVSDQSMFLYDDSGALLKSWTSTGTDEVVTGLGEGHYYILVGNRDNARYDFTVENANSVTNVNYTIWTLQSILMLAAAVVLIPMVIYVIVVTAVRFGRRRTGKR